MKYQARQGIVKMTICGVTFLTPLRSASKNCAPVFVLNFISLIVWQAIIKGKTIEEIYNLFIKLNMPENRAKNYVDTVIKALLDKGYVIEVE